jgi:gluconate 5-dehydrogenase
MGENLFDVTGKVAIVSGSGRGIGKAVAAGLAAARAKVVVCGRTPDIIEESAAAIREVGGEAIAVPFDAGDRTQVQGLIDTTVARYGRLDVMVVNHGIGRAARAEKIEPEAWGEMIAINLTSAFDCAQLAGRRMIEQGEGGAIVLVSSTGSYSAFRGLTNYGAAKGGVDQLCRQLASEWGRFDIRVNAVNPGFMTNHMRGSDERYDDADLASTVEARTPVGRRGAPEEIAGPVIFLASDAASYVTGHIMPIDGGYGIQGTP